MYFLFNYEFMGVNNVLIVYGEDSSRNYLMVVDFDVFCNCGLLFLLFLIFVDVEYVRDMVCLIEFVEVMFL